MNEIIKITEQNNQRLVDARELHTYLEVTSKFADWIKNRIEKYCFVENSDYVSFSKNLESGGRTNEYGLTIDTAKELCMVENNEKGRQARRYFIEKEKEANGQPGKVLSRKDIALMVIQQEEEIERLNLASQQQAKQIKMLAPKVEFMNLVLDADEKIDIGQAAKILELPFGRNTLFQKLRDMGIFFKNRNEPKQTYIERGYFLLKEKFVERSNHEGFVVIKVLVTQKGLEFISNQFSALPSQKTLATII